MYLFECNEFLRNFFRFSLKGDPLATSYIPAIRRVSDISIHERVSSMNDRKEPNETAVHESGPVEAELRSALEVSRQCCEERFRSVVQAAKDAIICIDVQGRIVFWNRGAEEIFGYTEAEAVGKRLTKVIPERFHAPHLEAMNRMASSGLKDINTTEVQGLTKGGDEVPLELSLSSWRTDGDLFFTGVLRDVTERKEMQKRLSRANSDLEKRVEIRTRELARANEALQVEIKERQMLEAKILEISAAEQRRIGQDLHDSLGQQLTGIAFMADLLQEKLRNQGLPEAADAQKIRGYLDEAITQVRTLARGLCPVDLAAGDLGEGLKEFADSIRRGRGVDCSFECKATCSVRDDTAALHLYHIAQEAVTNAVKHGRPEKILIRLDERDDHVQLEVIDDGVGIPDSEDRGRGLGLHIMNYRAGALDGTLEVRRNSGGGTRIRCSIPLRKALSDREGV